MEGDGLTSMITLFPYNIFSQGSQFSVSFWYKRKGTSTATTALLTNGNKSIKPSIHVTSDTNSIGVKFVTDTNEVLKTGIPVRYLTCIHRSDNYTVMSCHTDQRFTQSELRYYKCEEEN